MYSLTIDCVEIAMQYMNMLQIKHKIIVTYSLLAHLFSRIVHQKDTPLCQLATSFNMYSIDVSLSDLNHMVQAISIFVIFFHNYLTILFLLKS